MRKLTIILMTLALAGLIFGCGDEPVKEKKPEAAVKTEAPVKAPAAAGKSAAALSCYEIGFRTGRCAAKSMSGLPCEAGDDIPIPSECLGKPETEKGKKEGLRSVY
jgi:hypothetical protein